MTGEPVIPRRAFTLVETVVSMAITSVVMLACAAAMVLGSRAAEGGFGPESRAAHLLEARVAADQIVADLEVATEVKSVSPWSVAMVVPDRDGDAAPESIEYAWSGVPGADLERTYNGVTTVVAADVSRFSIEQSFRLATKGSAGSTAADLLGGVRADADLTRNAHALTKLGWVAQYIKPTLPGGTVSWSVSGVKFTASRNGAATGTLRVDVHAADGFGRPTGSSLGGGSLDISRVSTTPEEVYVGVTVSGLDPSAGVVFVFSTADSGPGSVYSFTPNADANLKLSSSSDGGASWSLPGSTSAMDLRLYGGYSGS